MTDITKLKKRKKLYLIVVILIAVLLAVDLIVAIASSRPKTAGFGGGNFDPSSMSGFPSGFDGSSLPSNFDTGNIPSGFNPGSMNGTSSSSGNTTRTICIVFAVILVFVEVICVVMFVKTKKAIRIEEEKNAKNKKKEPEAILDPVEERKRKQRKDRIILGCVLAVALVVVIFLVVLDQDSKSVQVVQVNEEVREATASNGSIQKTVKGSGVIDATEEKEVTIPGSITLMQYYVAEGDVVSAGDKIAAVEMNSVRAAIGDIESTLKDLDSEIMSVKDKTTSDSMTTPADGRVVKIYAAEGQDTIDVMYNYSSLMVLSLDGLLAVDIPNAGSFTNDTSVVVLDADGNEFTGTISAIRKDSVTVTVSMDDFTLGDTVSVKTEEGAELLEEGLLYVLNALKITGASGTIESIKVSEGDKVSAKDTLITFSNTDYTATYMSLLEKRDILESQYNTLVEIAKTGYLYADHDGIITGIDENLLNAEAATSNGWAIGSNDYTVSDTTVCNLIPNGEVNISITIDELDINQVRLGQTCEVTLDAITGQCFTGTVIRRSSTSENNGGNSKYTVTIIMDKTENMLLGMNASVTIPLDTTEDILVIPEDSLIEKDGHVYVYTSYDEKKDKLSGLTEIKTGLSDGANVEITEGLGEEQTVYYKYAGTISYNFVR